MTKLSVVQGGRSSHKMRPPGDGGGDGLEARIARLESDVQHIQTDVAGIREDVRELRGDNKVLVAMIITSALGLAGLMAKGFGWL